MKQSSSSKPGAQPDKGRTFFMTTTTKNKKQRSADVPNDKKQKHTGQNSIVLANAVYKQIKVEDIEFSALNYRKYISENALQQFAEELKQHGIISALTIRPIAANRYELVAGERRLRAARLAGLPIVPAAIVRLTDEQVTEIQLAENLQREDPHPMDEANAVKMMQDTGKTIDEIALRLGKSKQFVYVRLKLLNLIEPIREMFFAGVLTIQQALQIATISTEGQEAFFKDHCTKWKQKNFELHDLQWQLRAYRYDLKNAPFDTRDKKLLPDVGACNGCPFNSATVKSLFPEYAKQAVCTNGTCYQSKCSASLRIGFINALQLHEPAALLFYGEPSEQMQEFLTQLPDAAALPHYNYHQITILQTPEEPDKDDYTNDYNGEEENAFDAEGYEAAMEEYKTELNEYRQNFESGKYQKALLEKNGDFYPVLFNPEPPARSTYNSFGRGLTMKTVQEALKAGTATPALLEQSIAATLQREERAKELDRDKIQLKVHEQFTERFKTLENNEGLTPADGVALRLIVYQSLDYSSRQAVNEVLFEDAEEQEGNRQELFYQKLQALTEKQFSYLIRVAIACKPESKSPNNETGFVLYQVAAGAGIDVTGIEQQQDEKAKARIERMNIRIKELEKKAMKLKKAV
ncbi:MAG: ParB/RepB/Spo0J family partition protein [Agriterribacter sp.]